MVRLNLRFLRITFTRAHLRKHTGNCIPLWFGIFLSTVNLSSFWIRFISVWKEILKSLKQKRCRITSTRNWKSKLLPSCSCSPASMPAAQACHTLSPHWTFSSCWKAVKPTATLRHWQSTLTTEHQWRRPSRRGKQ